MTRRLGCLQEHVDSSGAYDAIPLASTLDIKSKDRTDGLQYRAGLHYVRLLSTLRHAFPCSRGQAETTVPVLCPGTLHEQCTTQCALPAPRQLRYEDCTPAAACLASSGHDPHSDVSLDRKSSHMCRYMRRKRSCGRAAWRPWMPGRPPPLTARRLPPAPGAPPCTLRCVHFLAGPEVHLSACMPARRRKRRD